ncbi:peptidase domain-containing ABC transporter [Xanthomonas translucens]|uniref:ABC transporter n=3 Tax=Xanthomonas campestris pv. translucens TaxID=343 RepID=A0A125PW61_XANCT|nr:peptidase domain-containing ABC transporter [Xanthomonas translucens]KWV15441.1 ABC transporter [Xanthomonas translucens]MCC8446664.1 peptidase domain-containing ABC transporter [Xanthomonas translucens pv. translucens]MCT8285636.1 peptidase domain-containing ABC transporter [Xanthomonas translucens pv. translucens]MCT8303294.1 peptidase domain-containing ABC transporter [Xanthomonas translucens pv. translucens]QSQ34010.1 peptidase domain-containing ABC transporter [Xanthomonas translucens 
MDVYLQSEASECGLASLAMVASGYGCHVSLPEMRRCFPLSLKGIKLSGLIQIAQQLGFSTRALRLDMEHFGQLKLPCILHWDLNHFVVLAKVGKSKFTILDPAIGERKLSIHEVSQHFTGVALELTPAAEFKPQKVSPTISARQLTGPINGLWNALFQIFLLSVALQVFVVLAPFYMQWVVDQALVSADRDLLAVLGLGFGLALLLQVGIGLLRGWSVVYLSSRLGLQWMSNVFAHLLKLPLDFFEKRHLGDVTSRMSSVQTIQHTLTTSFVEAIIDGLMAVVTLVLMLVYSWKLALVTLLAVVLYLCIRAIAYRPVRDRTEQQLVAAAKQQSHLLESLRGMQSLKIAGEEPLRRSNYDNLLNETVNQDVKLARMSLGFNTASQLVFGIERIAVIWIGARLALDNVFSVGMLVAYLAYKDQFAMRVSGLIDKWVEFRMLRLHGERLADIVLTPPEDDHALPEALPPAEPRIEVEGLSFRYAAGEPWVVKECSFAIEPGESVAIIGASGCGKTTLVKLLLGLLKPSEGAIRIGGHDLHKLGPRNVRAIVGAVMQDDQLFAGSIADNIGFFDPDFDLERVEAAARLAAVHEDIAAMPMGYHSLIGDMGSSLSGGQKQRVILARALYRQPKLLFLDEATSHLDVLRERLVNDAVKQLKLTKVIVAHRPETIASADRVLVMEQGRIVQELRPQTSPAEVTTASA